MPVVVEKKTPKQKICVDGEIQTHLRDVLYSARQKINELAELYKMNDIDEADAALFTERMLMSLMVR